MILINYTGQLLTSSSLTLRSPRQHENPSVSPLRGQRMVKHSSVASRTTWSVYGPSSHKHYHVVWREECMYEWRGWGVRITAFIAHYALCSACCTSTSKAYSCTLIHAFVSSAPRQRLWLRCYEKAERHLPSLHIDSVMILNSCLRRLSNTAFVLCRLF